MRGMAMEAGGNGGEIEKDFFSNVLDDAYSPEFNIDELRLEDIHNYSKKYKDSEHRVLASSILEYAFESKYPEVLNDADLKDKVEEKVQLTVVSVEKLKTNLSNEEIENFIIKTHEQVNISSENYLPIVLNNLKNIWKKYKEAYTEDPIINTSEKLTLLALWQIIHRAYPHAIVEKLE